MPDPDNKNLRFAIVSIVAVVVLFGILLFAHSPAPAPSSQTASSASSKPQSAPTSIVTQLASVPPAVLDAVNVGAANAKPSAINAPSLLLNAKPEVLYEGAEYCPYCAAERWSMVVALSRFGSFQGLGLTHSSGTDVFPNTQTLTFYKSTYTSNYLTFLPIEIYTNIPAANGYTVLQAPTPAENKIVTKYDAQPYLPASEAQSIPFIDFGGKYVIAGANYSPAVLAGKSASSIAGSLVSPANPIAKSVDGAANILTASLCKLTNNLPATTCDPTILSIEQSL